MLPSCRRSPSASAGPLDLAAVEEDAVGRPEVDEHVLVAFAADLAVASRHVGVADDDVALAAATDDGRRRA